MKPDPGFGLERGKIGSNISILITRLYKHYFTTQRSKGTNTFLSGVYQHCMLAFIFEPNGQLIFRKGTEKIT